MVLGKLQEHGRKPTLPSWTLALLGVAQHRTFLQLNLPSASRHLLCATSKMPTSLGVEQISAGGAGVCHGGGVPGESKRGARLLPIRHPKHQTAWVQCATGFRKNAAYCTHHAHLGRSPGAPGPGLRGA